MHGLHGDETSWTVKGNAEATLDGVNRFPGAQREHSRYAERRRVRARDVLRQLVDGTGRFEDYILQDLIPTIDHEFRTIADRSKRAVCGLSMGGYGAFALALRNPDVFSAAASISGALVSVSLMTPQDLRSDTTPRIMGPMYGPYAKELDLHVLAGRRVRMRQDRRCISTAAVRTFCSRPTGVQSAA
ncbi:alpha/beta hydrolase [Paenibacillus validus]|uniref:alpha/beta hydrolase n=1 Tax=Paenibacillus validus TaxID=44253 RepID=UPI003D287B39